MKEIKSTTDRDALSLTMEATFDAPAERVWRIWQDPRLLEKWWGPPGWPATFTRHEFQEGGHIRYFMTGPDGTQSHGWWTISAVEAPWLLAFEDGFGETDGTPDPAMPATRVTVELQQGRAGTTMKLVSRFGSVAELDQILGMGAEEGMKQAISQVRDLL